MKCKPNKWGIHLYDVVGYKYKYLLVLYDSNKGHYNDTSLFYRFVSSVTKSMSEITTFLGKKNCSFDQNSPSELWVVIIGRLYNTVVTVMSLVDNSQYIYIDKVYIFLVFCKDINFKNHYTQQLQHPLSNRTHKMCQDII